MNQCTIKAVVRLLGARTHKHTQPNTRTHTRTHTHTKTQKHIHTQGQPDTNTHTKKHIHTQGHSDTQTQNDRKKVQGQNVVLRLMCSELNQCTIRAVLRLLGTHSHQNTDRLRHTHTHTHKDTQTHIHTQGHSDTNTHTQNDRKTYKDKIVAMTLINVPLRQW